MTAHCTSDCIQAQCGVPTVVRKVSVVIVLYEMSEVTQKRLMRSTHSSSELVIPEPTLLGTALILTIRLYG